MKRIINIIFTLFLLYASFYYTSLVSNYIKNKDPLMAKIKSIKEKYYQEPISAIIENNTIIPGLNGKEVDLDKSYQNMKKRNIFQESLLVFKTISPSISLKDNQDKLIIQGNSLKKNISLLIKINDLNLLKMIKNSSINLILEPSFIEENKEYLNSINNNIITLETTNQEILKLIDYCYSLKEYQNYCSNKYTIYPTIINYDYYYNTYKQIDNGKIFAYSLFNEQNLKEFMELAIGIKNLGYKLVSIDKLIEE